MIYSDLTIEQQDAIYLEFYEDDEVFQEIKDCNQSQESQCTYEDMWQFDNGKLAL